MLYTFFVTQWNNPTRGDWTLEVKQDLEDFGIPCSFALIQSKSKLSFKNLVKVRAEEYAFNSLRRKQDLQLLKNATVYIQSRNQIGQFSSTIQGWKDLANVLRGHRNPFYAHGARNT